jgi:hypothetical protein
MDKALESPLVDEKGDEYVSEEHDQEIYDDYWEDGEVTSERDEVSSEQLDLPLPFESV